MRALERIEKLKQEGRWSFRQPKKQKGPVLAKSHWDWLLDEMVCQEINATGYILVLQCLTILTEMVTHRLPGRTQMEDRCCV